MAGPAGSNVNVKVQQASLVLADMLQLGYYRDRLVSDHDPREDSGAGGMRMA